MSNWHRPDAVDFICRHLRYVGTPDTGDKSRQTMVRNVVDVGVSENITQFLTDLGFK